MNYVTIICDIRNSKNIPDREAVQYRLIDMLKETNSLFAAIIVCPFIITLGDEWQGLLRYPCDYGSILRHFHEILGDIRFCCGIGIGDVTVHNFELTVNQLDGPSFYKARNALKLAKRHNYSIVMAE